MIVYSFYDYHKNCLCKLFVPSTGFEPARLATPPPQDGVSTNFTNWAVDFIYPSFKNWCPEQDSNLHTLRRCHLKTVRLPISPSGLYKERGANIQKIADFLNGTARFQSQTAIPTITKSTWHRHNTRNDILLSSPLDKPPS